MFNRFHTKQSKREGRTDESSEEQKKHEEQMEVMPEMANGEAAIVVV